MLQLPLKESFKTGFGVIATKGTVITKIVTDNGIVGWGESSSLDIPMYTHEWNEGIFLFLNSYVVPRLKNATISTIDDYRQIIAPLKRNNVAKAGPESALYDIFAKEKNLPLATYLGGVRKQIDIGESIGIKANINDVLKTIEKTMEEGRKRFKIKIEPGSDIVPLRAIRKAFPTIDLMVDANASYEYKRHKRALLELDELHLTMLEQPLGADCMIEHAKLQKEMQTPICLDESIDSIEDAIEAVTLGACKIVNIKPGRVGGIYNSQLINDYLAKHGVKTWCGGMMESTIGKAVNLAVASLPNFDYPADMSPPRDIFNDDVVDESFYITKYGTVAISREIGIGYEIKEEKVKYLASHENK